MEIERDIYDMICREIISGYHRAFSAYIDPKLGAENQKSAARFYFSQVDGMKRIVGRIYGFGVVREICIFLEEELSLCDW